MVKISQKKPKNWLENMEVTLKLNMPNVIGH